MGQDGFVVGRGVVGLAFGDGEVGSAACGLEFGEGDVEVGVVGVFPDVVGIGCLEDVGAVEEEFDHAGGWEGFVRAIGAEFDGESLQITGGRVS